MVGIEKMTFSLSRPDSSHPLSFLSPTSYWVWQPCRPNLLGPGMVVISKSLMPGVVEDCVKIKLKHQIEAKYQNYENQAKI